MYPNLSEFEQDLLAKLTQIFEQQAQEINAKPANQFEDIMWWATRP